MRSPVATSNGCAPVFASYSAMTRFTSSMSAVAGSYSRIVVSPWDENVRTFAFISGLLWDYLASVGEKPAGFWVPKRHHAPLREDVKTAFAGFGGQEFITASTLGIMWKR